MSHILKMKLPRLTTMCIVFFSAAILRLLMYTFPPKFLERHKTQKSRTKVLLLSYTRSGSSLLGELLSLHSSSTYIFEPYKKFELTCEQREDSSTLKSFYNKTLGGFLNCDKKQIDKLKQMYKNPDKKAFRKNMNCEDTEVTVIKTVRLHINGLDLLMQHQPDMKIVHLVRDPRYQMDSRLKRGAFECDKQNISGYCDAYYKDLILGSKISSSVYKLVKYEDLVASPLPTMKSLYDFIGLEISKKMETSIFNHFNAENLNLKNPRKTNNPYSTFRKSDYADKDLDMSNKRKAVIEESCRDVLDYLGYT